GSASVRSRTSSSAARRAPVSTRTPPVATRSIAPRVCAGSSVPSRTAGGSAPRSPPRSAPCGPPPRRLPPPGGAPASRATPGCHPIEDAHGDLVLGEQRQGLGEPAVVEQMHLIVVGAEARPRGGDVVGDDEVQVLLDELAARLFGHGVC